MGILISDNRDFKTKILSSDKETFYNNEKGLSQNYNNYK